MARGGEELHEKIGLEYPAPIGLKNKVQIRRIRQAYD